MVEMHKKRKMFLLYYTENCCNSKIYKIKNKIIIAKIHRNYILALVEPLPQIKLWRKT